MLDLPQEATNALLGYEESEDGIVWVGEDTRPPYAGIVMESNLLNGEPYFFSLLKGKFRLEEQTFETNEDQPQEPQPDELTGSFVAVNGITYGMAKGEDKRSLMLESFNKIGDDSGTPDEETP